MNCFSAEIFNMSSSLYRSLHHHTNDNLRDTLIETRHFIIQMSPFLFECRVSRSNFTPRHTTHESKHDILGDKRSDCVQMSL